MKTAYIIIIFLIASPLCYSQTYHPLVKEGRYWIYQFRQSEPENCGLLWVTNWEVHYFGKDTIISDNRYKPIIIGNLKIDNEIGKVYKPYTIINSTIAGYFREEIAEKKIYMLPTDNFFNPCDEEFEFLLFDYSLKRGDSINQFVGKLIGAGYFTESYSYIDSIVEKVYIDGKLTRFFYTFGAFRPCGLVLPRVGALVEGFGFEDGPIYGWHNREFIDYCEGTSDQCNIVSSTEDINTQSFSPVIFPNPVNEYLNINSTTHYDYLSIFNSEGKLLNVSTENQTNVMHLLPGIYFVKIVKNGLCYNLRFVKR